jgi:hypothetical protein
VRALLEETLRLESPFRGHHHLAFGKGFKLSHVECAYVFASAFYLVLWIWRIGRSRLG